MPPKTRTPNTPSLLPATCAPTTPKPLSFIRAHDLSFVDGDCRPFEVAGWNSFLALETAVGACCGGADALAKQFQAGADANMTVARVFAFPVKEKMNLQTAPGVFNDKMLVALDRLIASAGAAGVRLSLVLFNNWNYNGVGQVSAESKCGVAKMATGKAVDGPECDAVFWTNPEARKLYKGVVAAIVGRTNTLTGVKYADDPTIFSWSLINEPRCELKDCAQRMQDWIEEMAPYVKSLDPNHLLTLGSDGFYQRANCQSEIANPQRSRGQNGDGPEGVGWPLLTGQDLVPNHAVSAIDYIAVHLWPDNWGRPDPAFGQAWLREKARNAAALGKPVLLDEFGKAATGPFPQSTPSSQAQWYKLVYDAVAASSSRGGGLAGVMFWRWAVVDTGSDLGDFDRGSLITSDSPAFTNVIEPYAAAAAARNARGGAVKGCKKDGRKAGDAPAKTEVASAKPAVNATKPVATASVPAARKLAGWADTSDIDVSQLAVQLPGGYRPAGLSGPWAGATSSQMKTTWNPEFVPTPSAVEDEPPAVASVPTPAPKKADPKKTAAPAPAAAKPAPGKPAPVATPVANTTATKPAPVMPAPTPAATPAVDTPLDGARSAVPRLASSAKVDMDAINRRVTCSA